MTLLGAIRSESRHAPLGRLSRFQIMSSQINPSRRQ